MDLRMSQKDLLDKFRDTFPSFNPLKLVCLGEAKPYLYTDVWNYLYDGQILLTVEFEHSWRDDEQNYVRWSFGHRLHDFSSKNCQWCTK